jgi:hypothetical protein
MLLLFTYLFSLTDKGLGGNKNIDTHTFLVGTYPPTYIGTVAGDSIELVKIHP